MIKDSMVLLFDQILHRYKAVSESSRSTPPYVSPSNLTCFLLVGGRTIFPPYYSFVLTQTRLQTNFTLHQSLKQDTSPEIYRNKFFEICDYYKGFSRLYTDGSRMYDRVAAAVVHKSVISRTTRLPNKVSILTAELYAISLTLALVHCSNNKNFIIFSDSVSSLKAPSGFNSFKAK